MTPPQDKPSGSGELKRCPFCGEQPWFETRDVEPQGDPWYGPKNETFVMCKCGTCMFDEYFHEGFAGDLQRAAERWNHRPTPDLGDIEGLVERLKGKIASNGAWMTSDLRDFYTEIRDTILALKAQLES